MPQASVRALDRERRHGRRLLLWRSVQGSCLRPGTAPNRPVTSANLAALALRMTLRKLPRTQPARDVTRLYKLSLEGLLLPLLCDGLSLLCLPADVCFSPDLVRFTPESRRGSGRSRESEVDPTRTLVRSRTDANRGLCSRTGAQVSRRVQLRSSNIVLSG